MRTKFLLLVLMLHSTCCILRSSAQTALWSMAFFGGVNGFGAIIKMNLDGTGYARPLDFNDANGAEPLGSLMQATNGKLYGMTERGGSIIEGVLFSFDPSANTYAKLFDFNDSANGIEPYGNLMQATNGKLYGMTLNGGNHNDGVLFSFDPSVNTYSKLLDFNDTNGANPYGNLIQASNGKLYGMISAGGSNGYGVLFSFDPSTNTYSKLLDFNDTANGGNPSGSLIKALNGKLYGMTEEGGSNNDGVLFSFDPSANTYSKLFDFSFPNGANPFGSLMQASNGKLYGMTNGGGSDSDGVLFSFDPSANTYSKLLDFNDSADGAYPLGSLMQASNGKLYGMTYQGGDYDYGVLFSYEPTDSTYVKLRDLNSPDGIYPQYSSFIEVANTSGISELSMNENISVYPNPLTSTSILQLSTQLKNAEVVIYDMVGKELMRKKLSEDRMEIDKGSLESGIYFVRVRSEEKQWVEKLVVE